MARQLEQTETSGPASRRRPLRWLAAGAIAIAALVVGGVLLYTKVINDPEAELTTAALDKALETSVTTAAVSGGSVAVSSSGAANESSAATGGASSAATTAGATGTWTVVGAEPTVVGYRVEEVLFGANTTATGRTSTVTGSLTIDGSKATAATFTVDVASIASDDSRRDRQFAGRIMSTSEFPTATFVLTQPIAFGSVPAEGAQIKAKATGDLTLRGVTKSVTFDVTAQLEGGKVGVLGNIPITFTDYQIPSPSFTGITWRAKRLQVRPRPRAPAQLRTTAPRRTWPRLRW